MKNPSRARGRPRSFDRTLALAQAAETFWRLGYEGTSIVDLTSAMGITPQSLYAAFGSKAELYREALDWYGTAIAAEAADALESESDVVPALRRLLVHSARSFARPGRPPGCMVSLGMLRCAVENDQLAAHVGAIRRAAMAALQERLERGVRDGQLRPDRDAGALARLISAVLQGMSVQARDGADEAALTALAVRAAECIAAAASSGPDKQGQPTAAAEGPTREGAKAAL